MADKELQVIINAKKLAAHGNCYKLCQSMDELVENLLKKE